MINEPPWLQDLPRWGGKFPRLPSPAGNTNTPSPRKNGAVDPRADARRIAALSLRGCCSVCGYPLTSTGAWCHLPPEAVAVNGVRVVGGVGPMHGSCAMFSSLACPWMSSKPRSGEVPALTAFAGYGVVLGSQAVVQPGTPLRYGYFDPVEVVPHDDLRQRYEQSLLTDKPDTAPRLWWGDDADGEQRLRECAAEDARALRAMRHAAPAFPSVAKVWPVSSGYIDLTTDPRLRAAALGIVAAASASGSSEARAAALRAAATAGRRLLTASTTKEGN